MALRIQALSDIDPLAVPLPNGTEVTTRVDRVCGDRIVPSGAVGRVVATTEEGLDVKVVGVGVFRYARDELVPRKAGQLRYAIRREAAWASLAECRVLEATVGSRAWGLADAGSDTDRRGAFVLPFAWTTGLVDPPLDLISADGSDTYWEAGKVIRKALSADPNTLEMLFVENVRATDEMGQWLLDAREAFVSREVYGSFGRYALSQLKRLQQSHRLAQHRQLVLEWLTEASPPTLDQVATRLVSAAELQAPSPADAQLRAKQYIKQLYRSLYDQGLLERPDFESLQQLATTGLQDLDLPRELRPKNAYNLLRLIGVALDWLRTGSARLEVTGPLRERLFSIKRGEVPLAEVLAEAEHMTRDLEEARANSPLPLRGDVARADAVLRRIRAEAARRHLAGEPGPWGCDAPAPVEARWSE